MQTDGHAERLFRRADAGDVIDMGVRQQDVANRQLVLVDRREQLADFVARIDDDCLPGVLAADDEAVLEEGRYRACLENHAV